jgi:hypothetical protein
VNFVSSFRHGAGVRRLTSPSVDALALARAATARSFSAAALCNEEATVSNVTAAILSAAQTLHSDDMFVLTFSGHGLAAHTRDGFQQSWCLFDQPLLRYGDAGLDALLAHFRAGVRIFVVANCCHASTEGHPVWTPPIRAQVIRIAACRATELALESARAGTSSPFVDRFLHALGIAGGGYREFVSTLAESSGSITPTLEINEHCTEQFLRAGPFRLS